jgi:carbonic anhydrase
MFYDHLNIAVNLHNIKEVWVFDHLDCGMYKTTFGIESDLDKSIHVNYITELRKNLAESHPQLGFRGFVMMTDGHIEKIT